MPEFDENEIPDEAASPAIRQLREALKRAEKDGAQWRKMAEEAKESTAQLEALRKEAAMLRAGVPDTKVGKLFLKDYDGELTTEAIKAAWADLSAELGTPNTPPPSEEQDDNRRRLREEMAAADDLSRNMSGNLPPDREVAYEAELKAATTPEATIAVLDKYGKLARQD